jgi:hypothetical protein
LVVVADGDGSYGSRSWLLLAENRSVSPSEESDTESVAVVDEGAFESDGMTGIGVSFSDFQIVVEELLSRPELNQ